MGYFIRENDRGKISTSLTPYLQVFERVFTIHTSVLRLDPVVPDLRRKLTTLLDKGLLVKENRRNLEKTSK